MAHVIHHKKRYIHSQQIFLQVRGTTRNKLLRLVADEGLMKLCQICSRNKEFYDYREDAARLMSEIRTAGDRMGRRNDSIWQAAVREFDAALAAFQQQNAPKLYRLAELLTLEYSVSEAARELGLPRSTLDYRVKKLQRMLLQFLADYPR